MKHQLRRRPRAPQATVDPRGGRARGTAARHQRKPARDLPNLLLERGGLHNSGGAGPPEVDAPGLWGIAHPAGLLGQLCGELPRDDELVAGGLGPDARAR